MRRVTARADLWSCAACGRRFANRNQTHTCARLGDLDAWFVGRVPEMRAIFDAVLAAIRALGPVTVLPEKSRIAFQTRMSFAQLTPRRAWVDGHVVLARRLEHPRFRRIDSISAKNHVHHFRLASPAEVDDEVRSWLREAYEVGEQRHLGRGPAARGGTRPAEGDGVDALVEALRRRLADLADPARAPGAQAYMKSAMPFYGVAAKSLRAACKEVFAAHALATPEAWRAAALRLWREATHREERYAAIELTGARPYRKAPFQELEALPMYEEMIVSGAWWDYVDVLAVHRVGAYLLRAYPAAMKRTLLAWARGDDLWKRRSAILSQIAFKAGTDLDLFERCIAPSLQRREIWLRKAIGWALRQHAWTDPGWVVGYVKRHEDELSPLSKREALKHCGPAPKRRA